MDDVTRLSALLGEQPLAERGVVAVWLWGSRARGDARPDSDVDLAVLFGEEVPASDRLDRTLALETALEPMLDDLDSILVLNDAGLPVTHRVLTEGHLVAVLDDTARVRWEAPMRSLAMEFVEWAARERRTALRALAER